MAGRDAAARRRDGDASYSSTYILYFRWKRKNCDISLTAYFSHCLSIH